MRTPEQIHADIESAERLAAEAEIVLMASDDPLDRERVADGYRVVADLWRELHRAVARGASRWVLAGVRQRRAEAETRARCWAVVGGVA